MKWILVFAAVLGMAGCSQEVPNVPAPAPAPVPAPAAPAAAIAPALPAESVTVELSGVECVETPVAIATVVWDAGALAAGGVSIFVESPGNARKLWLEGAANGKADSGKWVFPDSRFTLQNRTSGEVLAQHDVGKLACPAT